MYEIGVTAQFEAALSLQGDFGPASHVHGHTYRVEVTIRGRELQAEGILFDIARLQSLANEALAPLHYQYLNDLPQFKDRNPTLELVAKDIYDSVAGELGGFTVFVRVWESPQAFAGYDGAG